MQGAEVDKKVKERKVNEMFQPGLAMGLAMGGQGPGFLKRIEAFKKEMEELGVEVRVTINIAGRNVK